MLFVGVLSFTLASCEKEEDLKPSDDFGIKALYTPGNDAPQIVKDIYKEHDVWVRMDFDCPSEVAQAVLSKDEFVYARKWVTKIDDDYRASAYKYTEKLFSLFPAEFTKKHFPLDIFIVKDYGKFHWKSNKQEIGRSRFVFCWPNEVQGALDVNLNDFENHFHQDTVLSTYLFNSLFEICCKRFEDKEGLAIQQAGWAYSTDYMDALRAIYPNYSDRKTDKYKAELAKIANDGGFIKATGSKSFSVDIKQWMLAIATHSHDEMKKKYLDNSPKRAAKYLEVIKFMKSKGWDIQATGNKYSELKKKHKLPAKEEK